MATVKFVPVSALEFAPENVSLRKPPCETDKDWDVTLNLKEAIRTQGLQNLFSVREENGVYYIIDGYRRATCVKALVAEGDPQFAEGINVQVQEKDEWDGLEAQISANYNIKRTLSGNEIQALNRLSQVRNYTLEELASKVGMSVAYVTQILKIKFLPEAAQAALNEGKMNITNAIQLGKLPAEEIDDEWIAAACTEKADALTAKISEKINALRKERQLQSSGKEPTFEPKSKMLSKEEIAILLTRAEAEYEDSGTDYAAGRLDVLKEIFSLDEKSVEAQKAVWDAKQLDAAQKKEERKKKLAEKKQQDIAEFLAAQGKKIVDAE